MTTHGSDVSLGLSPSTLVSDVELSVLNSAVHAFTRGVDIANLNLHASSIAAELDEALGEGTPIAMLPNHSIVPTGRECGDFLVVDLGGLTLRVAVISIAPDAPGKLRCERILLVVSNKWQVADARKLVDGAFFAWIAECIVATLAQQSVICARSTVRTGITWSFSLQGTSRCLGTLLHMGKGYTILPSVAGRDLNELLTLAVQLLGVQLRVQLIVNDSLAVYAAGRFLSNTTQLAMVLGTGVNLCCQLALSGRLHVLKRLSDDALVLFNTEASLFGSCLVESFATKYDAAIDPRFALPLLFRPHMELDPQLGYIFQPLELLLLGRYLPELVRLVLVDMVERGEIFAGQKNLEQLYTPYEGVTGQFVCLVSECDDHDAIARETAQLYHWDPRLVLLPDVVALKLVVDAVVRRAAFLLAVVIVGYVKLLRRHNGPFALDIVTIGYVGSVMEYFHRFRTAIAQFANGCPDVVQMGVQIELQAVGDSSLVGAAIGASTSQTC